MTPTLLRRLWPLAAVAVLLTLAAVAAAHSSLRFSRVQPAVENVPGLPEYQPPSAAPSFPSEEGQVAGAEQTHVPDWIFTVAGTLCVLVIAALVGVLIWMLVRDLLRRRTRLTRAGEGPRQTRERTAAEVVAALDAGLVDLSDTDADPRRAVIACWVRLEQAAGAAGVPREVGDTPTDLVTRLLRGGTGAPGGPGAPAIVSADVLAAFAHVYREARYATHTVDERMRAQARSALTRLRAELTAGVSG